MEKNNTIQFLLENNYRVRVVPYVTEDLHVYKLGIPKSINSLSLLFAQNCERFLKIKVLGKAGIFFCVGEWIHRNAVLTPFTDYYRYNSVGGWGGIQICYQYMRKFWNLLKRTTNSKRQYNWASWGSVQKWHISFIFLSLVPGFSAAAISAWRFPLSP